MRENKEQVGQAGELSDCKCKSAPLCREVGRGGGKCPGPPHLRRAVEGSALLGQVCLRGPATGSPCLGAAWARHGEDLGV